MRQYYNIAAYVTGAERTTIGASIMDLENFATRRAYEADGYDGASGGLDVPLPTLKNVSILRTDTAVKQLEILNPSLLNPKKANASIFSGLLVRTGTDISLHRWSYESLGDSSKTNTIRLESTQQLALKQGVSDPVVHCCASMGASNWVATVRGSGALSLFTYHVNKGHWTYVKCPPLRVGETFSHWHRVKEVASPSYSRITPEAILVANRKALLLYDARVNQYVGNLLPNINTMTTSLRDFQTAAVGNQRNLNPPGERNKSGDHQYFVLTSDRLQWMDMRYPKDILMSVPHYMEPRDPSLQLTMSYLEDQGLHVATVYSEMSQLTTVLEFGRDTPIAPQENMPEGNEFESLPVMPQNAQVFATEPSKRTQTLRTFELRPKVIGASGKFKKETPPVMMGAFQYTLEHGLYTHVWSSDSTVDLDLHDKVPNTRASPLHEIMLSRGLEDPTDRVNGPQYLDLRKVYKLLYDFKVEVAAKDKLKLAKLLAVTAQKVFNSSQRDFGTVSEYKEILDFPLATNVTGLKKLFDNLHELGSEGVLAKVASNMKSLLDSTKMDSIDEFREYLRLLWVSPLAGFAPSRSLERSILESEGKPSQRFTLPHPRLAHLSKSQQFNGNPKGAQKVKIKRDVDSDSYTKDKKRRLIKVQWYRPKKRCKFLTRRSVTFPKNHPKTFISQRKQIVERIAVDVSMACQVMRVASDESELDQNTATADNYLAPLRKYTRTLLVEQLSTDMQKVLSEWQLEDETAGTQGGEEQLREDTYTPYSMTQEAADSQYTATPSSQSMFPMPSMPPAFGTPLKSALSAMSPQRRRKSMRFAPLPTEPTPADGSISQSNTNGYGSQLGMSSQQTWTADTPGSSQMMLVPPPMSQTESQMSASQKRRRRSTMVPSQQTRKRRKTTEGF